MQPEINRHFDASLNPVLAHCSEEMLVRLRAASELRAFDVDTVLLREGESAAVVLFPLSGSLQMSKTASRGRRQVLCNVDSGGCGGLCMLTMTDRGLADVHALQPGEVLVLQRDAFQELSRVDQGLCQAGWTAAMRCMEHLGGLVESLSFRKVVERVALALLENTQRDGDLLRRTQSELAAEVGTTREVVARCLAGLQRSGVVRLGRGRITVVSRERLGQGI